MRENLGKGLQEFKKEALRESSTLIREVSKVGPALIKENTVVNSGDQGDEPTEEGLSSNTENVCSSSFSFECHFLHKLCRRVLLLPFFRRECLLLCS